jgi:hypothetical protein
MWRGIRIVAFLALVYWAFQVAAEIRWRHEYHCNDCFALSGFPFHYYNHGGYAGGGGYLWLGVIGNIVTLFASAAVLEWTWGELLRRGGC